jgi:hypothetical protein
MKKLNLKWLLNIVLIITATIAAPASFAGTGTTPAKDSNPFELRQIAKDKVMISCHLVASGSEYYEIERSSDNHDFKAVCLVFPATAGQQMRNGIDLKDKIAEQKVVYYRIKKISGNEITYTEAKAITLQ